MEYKIVIEEHAGQKILHTYIMGDLYEKERDQISMETIQKLNDSKIHKSIWDVREARLKYSLTKIHMSVVNAEAAGLRPENCVAVIYQNNKREYEHAKLVTQSRSMNNLEYFQNFDEAIHWLAGR
jgi:hypothetical protein